MLKTLKGIQAEFNQTRRSGKKISLVDLIVMGGGAAIEQTARNAGHSIKVPLTPSRADAA